MFGFTPLSAALGSIPLQGARCSVCTEDAGRIQWGSARSPGVQTVLGLSCSTPPPPGTPSSPGHQPSWALTPLGKSFIVRERQSASGPGWGRFGFTLPEQLEASGVRWAASCSVPVGHQAPENYSYISQQATPEHQLSSSGMCLSGHQSTLQHGCTSLFTACITSLELPAMHNMRNTTPKPDQSKSVNFLLIIKIFRVFNVHYQTQSEALDDKELLRGLPKNPTKKMFIVDISLIYMLIFNMYFKYTFLWIVLDFKREYSLSRGTLKKNEISFFRAHKSFVEPFIEPF